MLNVSAQLKNLSLKAGAMGLAMAIVLVSGDALRPVERETASMAFPLYKNTSDVGDIMDDYPAYLNFALTIGKDVNPGMAKQISERFTRLKRADEKYAARFLKGLRFEMIQKLELTGLSPKRVTTENPTLRRWVAKYIGAWLREVDEYQFRAFAASIAKRD